MNALPSAPLAEPCWKTYLKAAPFLLPAVIIWVFSGVFLFPKLQHLWQHAGLGGSEAQWIMSIPTVLVHGGRAALGALVLAVVILEWRSPRWAAHRAAGVVAIAALLNTAVLVGLAAMCLSALLAAPNLAALR